MFYKTLNIKLLIGLLAGFTTISSLARTQNSTDHEGAVSTVFSIYCTSTFSTCFTIATASVTLSNSTQGFTRLSVYPNPLNARESIYIKTESLTPLSINQIELLNVNGQIIEVFKPSDVDFGQNLIEVDFEKKKQSTGIYFLKIMTRQNVNTHKIIIR